MNSVLARSLVSSTPQINDETVNGIAPAVFDTIPEYLNRMIKISMGRINKNVDFKYHGYYFPSPEEELMEDVYSRASNKPADITQNDVYLCCFKFTYNGTSIPKYIYLPFAEPGNLFTVSGTRYVVMPVITDLVISVKPDHLFVRLHKDKISVFAELRRVILNGNPAPELMKMLWCAILKGPNDKMRPNPKTPLGLYLLAKFGLRKVLRDYCLVDPTLVNIIYDENDAVYDDPKIVNNYNIYSSVGERPKGYDRGSSYHVHKIKILVHKDLDMDPMLTNLVIGVMYILDLVNGQVEEDLAKFIADRNVKKEIATWRFLLCKGVYKNIVTVDKINEDIEQHMDALDDYMDEILHAKLKHTGVIVPEFWDLVAHLINIYSASINNAKEYNRNPNSVYLDLNYIICYDIIVGFNRAIKQINQRMEKVGSKQPSRDEIKRIIGNDVSEKVIFNLVKSSSSSLALASADNSGDSFYYKGTAMIENQNRGNGVRRGGKTPFPDNMKVLHPYHVVIGCAQYLTKSAPSPLLRLNPYARFDPETGHVIIPEDLQKTVDGLDKILSGMSIPIEGLDTDIVDEEASKEEPDEAVETEEEEDDVAT